MPDRFRSIIYKLNESNSNNPANLLLGQVIDIKRYKNGKEVDSIKGRLNSITNDSVCVKEDSVTGNSYLFSYNGFNNRENMIEFVGIDDPNLRFYV